MKDRSALALLDRPIPASMAARLFGVAVAVFASTPPERLTLLVAFRLARNTMIEQVVKIRSAKRGVLRRTVAEVARDQERSISPALAEMIRDGLRASLADEMRQLSARVGEIDPDMGQRICAISVALGATQPP